MIWWLRGSTGFLKVFFVINKQHISSRALKVHLTNEGLWCQVHTLKLWPFLNKPCSLNMMPWNCFISHCNCTCNNNGSKCNKSKVLLLSQQLVFKQHILYTCPKAIAVIDSVHVWISGWNESHHFFYYIRALTDAFWKDLMWPLGVMLPLTSSTQSASSLVRTSHHGSVACFLLRQ